MKHNVAVNLLGKLGNDIRLRIFRMLIQAGSCGLKPTEISKTLDLKPNKVSFHLNNLKQLELIHSSKTGRQITYFANYETIQDLVTFLFEKCCQGEKTCNPVTTDAELNKELKKHCC